MATGWFQQVTYRVWALLKDTATAWSEDKVPRHGAALAYYTVFSIVPLLVVVIAIIGLLFGREATESYILDQIADVMDRKALRHSKTCFSGQTSRAPVSWPR
jgi:membrane protein